MLKDEQVLEEVAQKLKGFKKSEYEVTESVEQEAVDIYDDSLINSLNIKDSDMLYSYTLQNDNDDVIITAEFDKNQVLLTIHEIDMLQNGLPIVRYTK